MSEHEREALHDAGLNSYIEVLPLIMDNNNGQIESSSRSDIIFVGGFGHSPNIDAVKYFVSEVMPLIRKKLKGVKFYIVGTDPPPEIKHLASSDVIVMGYVQNLNELLASMKVSVAPLRFGAGVKGKVATSLANGVPVVATAVAVEGMNLHDQTNVLVAQDAIQFAQSIIDLFEDQQLWNKLSNNGMALINLDLGPDKASAVIKNIFQRLNIGFEDKKYEIKLFS